MEQITRGVPSFFPVVSGVLIKSNPVPIVSFRIYGENCPCLMSSIILLLVGLIPAFCMLKHMKSIEIVFFFSEGPLIHSVFCDDFHVFPTLHVIFQFFSFHQEVSVAKDDDERYLRQLCIMAMSWRLVGFVR